MAVLAVLSQGLFLAAVGQTLPVELLQDATRYNLQSTNGMPLSNDAGNPPGSDGRAPGPDPGPIGTPNQFQGAVAFGGLVIPNSQNLNTTLSYAANAHNLNLPRNSDGTVVLASARVGAPVLSRHVSFLFGAIIPPPETDEYGVLLSETNTDINPHRLPVPPTENYWRAEPYTTTDHEGDDYYWSPHAGVVFAVKPGPIEIVWRRSQLGAPQGSPPDVGTIEDNGTYTIYTQSYIVSGSAAKQPRKMYWTEGVFRTTGRPITVPTTRIGGLHVVYYANFPDRVEEPYKPVGEVRGAVSFPAEDRTFWYDQNLGQIYAYNIEGRIFIELLGDTREDGVRRRHLGYEIVDVMRQPTPVDVTVELGELLTAYPNGNPDDTELFPEPVITANPLSFTHRHTINGVERPDYYATRETQNINDLTVHWLETGMEGLRWPFLLSRYRLVWPSDVTKFSHYVRPLVSSDQEARETSVILPAENAPVIVYQDPLDQPRGFLTEQFEFYTFLAPHFPAHRALLRYMSGNNVAFERVFSWLDDNLKSGDFADSLAVTLDTWDPVNHVFDWPEGIAAPRKVSATVHVGDRVGAPSGELGGGLDPDYLAGHIRPEHGDFYNPNAYADPFVFGFEAANRGAIIPVNAGPGRDYMEIWWFRKNQVNEGAGFLNTFWPSVIGQYTVQWPANPSEIILASNQGSGALPSLQARGGIYFQNDTSQPGYNPNEEHALMQGGQVFALRDDLNLTGPENYSSEPFVLLEYEETDGRPAMRAFKVLREKPEAGILFDYAINAGTIVQAPMPLPLLEKPMRVAGAGQNPSSVNEEVVSWLVSEVDDVTSSPVVAGTVTYRGNITLAGTHPFRPGDKLGLHPSKYPFSPLIWFHVRDVKREALEGNLSTLPSVRLTPWSGAQPDPPDSGPRKWRFGVVSKSLPPLEPNTPVILFHDDESVGFIEGIVREIVPTLGYVEVEVEVDSPTLPDVTTLVVKGPPGGIPGLDGAGEGWRLVPEPVRDNFPEMIDALRNHIAALDSLSLLMSSPGEVSDEEVLDFYTSFTLQDREGDSWIYRGPHHEGDEPFMAMRFYYKTLPGFYFPTLSLQNQPPVGTITPYLRPLNDLGEFVGGISGAGRQALPIRYRPVWPENAPVLQMAESLTLPKRGLPAMRGQSSLRVVYQQSESTEGPAHRSVVLHDPTREKMYFLGTAGGANALGRIPSSVAMQPYRGLSYFPALPPHLAERFFFDPNRGSHGALVLAGEFVDAPVGDRYLLLNVVGQQDAEYLKELCHQDDNDKSLWDQMVDNGLTTVMERFVEDPAAPGMFTPIVADGVVPPHGVAEVTHDDVAVDSYALSAVGPGTGYVTLISGNGRAFTDPGEPVSIHVLRVVDTLYRGEVKVIASSNPLNEKLTLQQVVDLAGKMEDYDVEWKIAAPVDGLPPVVYQNTPVTLLGDGTWAHVRFPVATDTMGNLHNTPSRRVAFDVGTSLIPVNRVPFLNATRTADDLVWLFTLPSVEHDLVESQPLTIRSASGIVVLARLASISENTNTIEVRILPDQNETLATDDTVLELYERVLPDFPQALVFREFNVPEATYSQIWLSLELHSELGAKVYIDGQPAVTANTGTGDTPMSTAPGGLSPLSRTYRLPLETLGGGRLKPDGSKTHRVAVQLFSQAHPEVRQAFNLRIEAYESLDVTGQQWLPLGESQYQDKFRAIMGGGADVQSLGDNYLIMRYQANRPDHASWRDDGEGGNTAWSQWTAPQLAEGWIKRVLAGINPFNQRVTDLFNNQVSTEVSIIAQAGPRWEGDVALNLEVINDFGLIEIYETVLNRGKMLSIGNGINYGPANDALLLAAGYLNDLYMMLGNEAWADAANPTIGIGTKDSTYGDIATALFAFRGQLATLLDEELALMRGRDDFLLPGVELRPVYNRLIWNYTRGIDAGEVIYALNYNILDQNGDGVVDADDARQLFPQGHGDAYGHFLTALKGYYTLLLDPSFDWVPRIEAVTVLGVPVSVDYLDERKFAAAAGALARAGRHIFDLTWRKDYKAGKDTGWEHFSETRVNTTTRNLPTTRYWGMDHWASRTGNGAYLNWVVGNAILPDVDPDPTHEGIQQIDRTTVPELRELVSVSEALQTALDQAEAHMTPLGLPESTIPFDLTPSLVLGSDPTTHFEQVYERAKVALRNALAAFDDAKDVTRLMRSEEDSLADFRATVDQQEMAYNNMLIEIYGTPYPDDIGPGRTYRTGYTGPDLFHHMYVDSAEIKSDLLDPSQDRVFKLDMQTFKPNWLNMQTGIGDFSFILRARAQGSLDNSADYEAAKPYIEYHLDSHGFFSKPESWTGQRASPGRLQQAISDVIKARNNASVSLSRAAGAKGSLDWALEAFDRRVESRNQIRTWQQEMVTMDRILSTSKFAKDVLDLVLEQTKADVSQVFSQGLDPIPDSLITGTSWGGHVTAPAKAALSVVKEAAVGVIGWTQVGLNTAHLSLDFAVETAKRGVQFDLIEPEQWDQQMRDATTELRSLIGGVQGELASVNLALQQLDDAQRAYRALVAEGARIQEEREIFRLRSAAIVQGFRTRDAAFRIFRNEKLERYKTLFDLAARYAFMAAQAFDYETGLLHTDQGKEFVNRIVSSRALGVMRDGEPQFAGSNTGDPGLSSAMAEMYADWLVLRGRLGFNNPDTYGTTVSLRTEQHRLLPGIDGDSQWKDLLHGAVMSNLLDDSDVRRYCMQISSGNGLPVPGILLEFSTVIDDGLNLFGQALAAGDHAFSPSSFATKIFAVGVALEGYRGMDNPASNASAVNAGGGASPQDPSFPFLDPLALAATPYVYLIPVGVDSMRSPPLGDVSVIRSWNVDDVTIPLPFNIGGSGFSTKPLWQSSDSLSEPLFGVRKHQAFRPVSSAGVFSQDVLSQSQFTNQRLIGRSVWNSKWKLVIPGHTLLNNPHEGIHRFIHTVKDVRLHFVTYSYSGN